MTPTSPTSSTRTTTLFDSYFTVPSRITMETNNMSNMSEFYRYINFEKVKSIDMPSCQLKQSLRIWFKEFEQQANFVGSEDMNSCTIQLGKYMPNVIKNWLPTQPTNIRQSWMLLKEQLLLHFGLPADEENRQFLTQLRKCKQNKNESIKLHSAKWEHLCSLLPENQFQSSQQIYLFTQSLSDRGLRSTIVAYVELKDITTLNDVILKAIDIENKAKLNEEINVSQETGPSSIMEDPMEVDYTNRFNKNKKKFTNQYQKPVKKGNHFQAKHKTHGNEPLRLYDKHGKPVCGHCGNSHRNYECKLHRDHNVSYTDHDDNTDKNDLVELQAPSSASLGHIDAKQINVIKNTQENTSFTPTTKIVLSKETIHALWDTGSAITAMDYDTALILNVKIDNSETIKYSDVNNKSASTLGTVRLSIFNQEVIFHVIKGLARQIIIGWDIMNKWKVNINTAKNMISLHSNNKSYNIAYQTSLNKTHSIHLTDEQDQQIQTLLHQHEDLMRSDSDKPSVTNKIQFTIDTSDHEPVYSRPRYYHPEIQKKIDKKFDELERNGIVSKVCFTEWGSPVTTVPKSDGSIRICGNYVKLNAITQTVKYPFINLHHALQSLGRTFEYNLNI